MLSYLYLYLAGSDGEEEEKEDKEKRAAVALKLKQKVSLRAVKAALEKNGALSDVLIVDGQEDGARQGYVDERKRFVKELEVFCAQVLPTPNDDGGARLSWEDFLNFGMPFLLAEAEKGAIGGSGDDAVSYGTPLLQLKASIDVSDLVKDGVCDGTWLLLDDDLGDDLIPISPHQYPPYIRSTVRLTRGSMPSTTELDMDLRGGGQT